VIMFVPVGRYQSRLPDTAKKMLGFDKLLLYHCIYICEVMG
jgi:hypothetical protein